MHFIKPINYTLMEQLQVYLILTVSFTLLRPVTQIQHSNHTTPVICNSRNHILFSGTFSSHVEED